MPSQIKVALPNFVHPLPPSISSVDVVYLKRKGALTAPSTKLRNDLLKCYVEFVHPFMPVVDLQDLLLPVVRDDGENRMSLLLFQAVMYSAAAFADIQLLKHEGYETRKIARNALFHKAKV